MTNKYENINKIIGKKIKLERIKRDLSQDRLGEIANISKNFVGAVERGESSPTIETLAKIANAFEISLSDLVDVSKVDI